MTNRVAGLLATAALTVAACTESPPKIIEPVRLETLGRAFAASSDDPEGACVLFAAAGPGPTLEDARLRAWHSALQRSEAGSDRWRQFVAARPPEILAGRATLALAAALAKEGDRDAAISVLVDAPESHRHLADLELLDLADEETAAEASHRLALAAPHRLKNHSRSIERGVIATLDHDEWMTRASAWRSVGLGSRAAAELRALRRNGDQEKERRMELARCELDAGSSTRALNALPSSSNSDPGELVLRAEAYRRRGWGRVPDRNATSAFRSCLQEAAKAADRGAAPTRTDALVLVLECGTEAGDLPAALAAWRELEASGWRHPRRTWLGRRLGVAMARTGSASEAVEGLASSLPSHARCLSFWRSVTAADTKTLHALSQTAVTDLYGSWARRHLGRTPMAVGSTFSDPVGAGDPPASVAWLLANGGLTEASDEWQRVLDERRPTRAEGLGAAVLAADAGRPNTAIRTLRKTFPGISSVAITQTPTDAAAAYLPLRWAENIVAAASETGLDPWLIAAVARQESTFIAHARSPAGARGVLQLLPSTARLHSRALGLGTRPDLEDPAVNIRIGARELSALVGRLGDLEPALAAYNAGERRVRRWWRRWPEPEIFAESIPIPETYTYVRRVVFLSDAYRQVHTDAWRMAP